MKRPVVSACAVLVVVCSTFAATVRARPKQLNLLIITLDTTRADRLGAYGSTLVATPHLDWLAHRGVVFEQAATVAPLTLPAHCSLFTGRLPPAHGVRDNSGFTRAPTQMTLAGVLSARGFRTAAFPASVIVGAGQGLAAGFDVYADDFAKDSKSPERVRRPGDQVVDRALSWLEVASASRFFAWVHLYDAHAPYTPPEPYRTIYAGRPYDGAVAFEDAQVGRLLTWLQRRQLLDRTIVVVVADHGESLGEHGEWTHGVRLYESVLHVPLILRAPAPVLAGRRIASLVRSVDVMPTVLDLLRVPSPTGLDGVSLVPLLTGATADLALQAYAETLYPRLRLGWPDARAIRRGPLKLIRQDTVELYDVINDPGEQCDLASARPDAARDLEKRLDPRRMDVIPRDATAVDPEWRERLASLGYVSGRRVAR